MIFSFDRFEVDDGAFRLSCEGKQIALEPTPLRLLLFLIHNPNRLVRKREILASVWQEAAVSDAVLTRSIGLLRKALGDDSRAPRFIETVPTVGYRFIAEIAVHHPRLAPAAPVPVSNPALAPQIHPAPAPQPAHPRPRKRLAVVLVCLALLIAATALVRKRLHDAFPTQARVVLTPTSTTRQTPGISIDPAAHDAYLRGRYFLQKQDMRRSAGYFQQAVLIEPTYASAYAGLADALDAESAYGLAKPIDAMPRAMSAAKHAIELAPDDGEAYTALGSVQTIYEWDWPSAEQNLIRGIQLSPSYSLAEMKYAIYLDAMARPEEAVTHMRRALDLDPMSFFMNRRLGSTFYLARHYDQALSQLRLAAEMEPTQHGAVDSYVSLAYEMKGMRDEAVEHDLAALKDEFPALDAMQLHLIYQHKGWEAYWAARIKALQPLSDYSCTPYEEGVSYLRLGDRDRAFSLFNRAVDRHCFWMALVRVDPLMDSIRSDSRYSGLLQRLNMSAHEP